MAFGTDLQAVCFSPFAALIARQQKVCDMMSDSAALFPHFYLVDNATWLCVREISGRARSHQAEKNTLEEFYQ